MADGRRRLTRRQFLTALGAIGGAGAVYHGLTTLGLLRVPSANAADGIPEIGHDIGADRRVVVLGAGLAGLCAAYLLANNGFMVKVVEASSRYGGRSLTLRQGDRFAEVDGPEQLCRFTSEDLYFNAGPGRIPAHHGVVLEYCRRFKVPLQPYIFLSEANLLQNDAVLDGRPAAFRRLRHDLRGQIAELLAKAEGSGALDAELGALDRERFLAMLQQFGALKPGPDGALGYSIPADPSLGLARSGYRVNPGAGLNMGQPVSMIDLETIVAAGFWNTGLFNHLRYYWQTSLLQPVGGMDLIWRAFLRQPVPAASVPEDVARGGDGPTVRDLVTLASPVTAVRNSATGVEVEHGNGRLERAEFCLSTLAPGQLLEVGQGFSKNFVNLLGRVDYVPACKVAWQTKNRFWETEAGIYGGISWTRHPISQIWYPSTEYHSETGVLIGAYNDGYAAWQFGQLPLEQRFELALQGGEKLHPGHYRRNVMRDTALAVAWHRMPYLLGGWANDTHQTRPASYERLVQAIPEGQIYLAGDYLSYWPGWQEGALAAANLAYEQIRARVAG